ncbi:MAG: phage portal protein [Gammaproteobacteria bacterium]|nr:phage portal protein [Gammaproteobacteria bacterium]
MSPVQRLARWLLGETAAKRSYAAGQPSRLSFGGVQPYTSSEDQGLATSLVTMRNRSRAAIRDNAIAQGVRQSLVNSVIGPSGVGMDPDVWLKNGEPNRRVNDDIRQAWNACKDRLDIGARNSFADLERLLFAEVVATGEVFVRVHRFAASGSKIALSLEVIEAERIAGELEGPNVSPAPGNVMKMGVEVDRFGRAVAYYVRTRHPGEARWGNGSETDKVERVPASEILHICPTSRWPQTRGVPMLHAVLRTLTDVDAYSAAEIARARVQAASPITIETPESQASFAEQQEDGTYEVNLEPGMVTRLAPGEKLNASPVNAPNPAFAEFMRSKYREVAVGIGLPYTSVSGDYSQSNYSSARLENLVARDTFKALQQTYINQFRKPLHRLFVQTAAMSGLLKTLPVDRFALDMETYEAAMFYPRGFVYVDPQKDIAANVEAINNGLTSRTAALANGDGRTVEDVFAELARENELAASYGLTFVATKPDPATAEKKPEASNEENDTATKLQAD